GPPRPPTPNAAARASPARGGRGGGGEGDPPPAPAPIGHRLDERARPPDVVHPRREDRDAVRTVALELVVEVVANSRKVLLERESLVVRQPSVARLRVPLAVGQQRAHSRGGITGGRSGPRVAVGVET